MAKRSVVLGGRKTSITLEDPFWLGLKRHALTNRKKLFAVIEEINQSRGKSNLSSACRQFVLAEAQKVPHRADPRCIVRHVTAAPEVAPA